MPHVMVPCPAEHVQEFTLALMRISLGMAGWTDASVSEYVSGLDPVARSLVDKVATVSIDFGRLSYHDAAKHLGSDVGSVLELVTDINDRCQRSGLPSLMMTDTHAETTANGDHKATPVLVIVRPVAEKILQLARRTNA